MMTSEAKLHYGGAGFRSKEGAIRCPADAILNGFEERNGDLSKPKRCSSMLEYSNRVADGLPQRQAFYVVDLADVLWKVQEWKRRLPDVDVFYAVKANTDPILLQLLSLLGLSFDCASAEEIQMALNAGASPDHIIFAHTIKPVEELEFASEKGVALMTFDNEDELRKIQQTYPDAKLVIRLTPCNVSCSFDLSDKFGCSQEEAVRLLKLSKQLNLNVVGISFHVGALCDDPQSFTSTIHTCRQLFDEARKIGYNFSLLDIGGGFFGHSGTEPIFYKMADSIDRALKEDFSDVTVRIIGEPGTLIANSAFSLVCTVLGKRCFEAPEEGRPSRHYYLNDGVYGSFYRGIECYGIRPVPLLPESEIRSRSKHQSRIFGQTCCSEDVIQRNATLPDLKIGERVLWENMGAYSLGVSSTFCGTPLPIPKYVFVQHERLEMDWISNREDVEIFLKKHVTFIDDEMRES